MSLAKDIETIELPDGVVFPPSALHSDEPPLESYLHLQQMILLLTCLEWWWRDRQDFFAAGNLMVYYSLRQRGSEHFRGPDFFVVLGIERKPCKSWIVWEEEGKYPNLIVEILSSTTASTDRGLKKQIFQDIFRTPDYFWFDPDTPEFQGFHLLDGQYQALKPNAEGRLWSQQLKLYLGLHDSKLRFLTPEGLLVLSPTETALQEQQSVLRERQRADEQLHRADQLAERLQALGVDISDF